MSASPGRPGQGRRAVRVIYFSRVKNGPRHKCCSGLMLSARLVVAYSVSAVRSPQGSISSGQGGAQQGRVEQGRIQVAGVPFLDGLPPLCIPAYIAELSSGGQKASGGGGGLVGLEGDGGDVCPLPFCGLGIGGVVIHLIYFPSSWGDTPLLSHSLCTLLVLGLNKQQTMIFIRPSATRT